MKKQGYELVFFNLNAYWLRKSCDLARETRWQLRGKKSKWRWRFVLFFRLALCSLSKRFLDVVEKISCTNFLLLIENAKHNYRQRGNKFWSSKSLLKHKISRNNARTYLKIIIIKEVSLSYCEYKKSLIIIFAMLIYEDWTSIISYEKTMSLARKI